MRSQPTRIYTMSAGVFLLAQGTSTLAFRLIPSLDQSFPPLLGITKMVPPHSLLHILTGLLALVVLWRSRARGPFWFALGFGSFYLALALLGITTGHPVMLGLQDFDHPFHILLGVLGILSAALQTFHSQAQKEGSR